MFDEEPPEGVHDRCRFEIKKLEQKLREAKDLEQMMVAELVTLRKQVLEVFNKLHCQCPGPDTPYYGLVDEICENCFFTSSLRSQLEAKELIYTGDLPTLVWRKGVPQGLGGFYIVWADHAAARDGMSRSERTSFCVIYQDHVGRRYVAIPSWGCAHLLEFAGLENTVEFWAKVPTEGIWPEEGEDGTAA